MNNQMQLRMLYRRFNKHHIQMWQNLRLRRQMRDFYDWWNRTHKPGPRLRASRPKDASEGVFTQPRANIIEPSIHSLCLYRLYTLTPFVPLSRVLLAVIPAPLHSRPINNSPPVGWTATERNEPTLLQFLSVCKRSWAGPTSSWKLSVA